MKTPIISAILLWFAIDIHAQSSGSTQPQDTPYAVVQRDANSRVWERMTYEQSPSGEIISHVRRYTELATGLHYQKNGQWLESKEEIDVLPTGGASATQGSYQVYFPGDIYQGQLELVTPDGQHLHSRPMGISYDDGSNTVLIAQLKDSVGQLVSSNQVIYPDAFTDFKADLVCTYRRSGFESDVVFRDQPPGPDQYGLNPQTSRLQLLTEFFDTPEPTQTTGSTNQPGGLSDTTLQFGKTTMGHGKAFSISQTNQSRLPSTGTRVYKSWLHLDGRTFLVEQLPYRKIRTQLQSLPVSTSATSMVISLNSPLHKVSASRLLVSNRVAQKSGDRSIQLARANVSPKPGVVLDYITVDPDPTDYTFHNGTTYFVSGAVNLSGTTTIQGGAIIKYAPGYSYGYPTWTAYLEISGSVISPGASDSPAIFTAADDNSVGEPIQGYSGVIQGAVYGDPAIYLPSPDSEYAPATVELKNMRVSYANVAFVVDYENFLTLSDSQVKSNSLLAVLDDGGMGGSETLGLTCNNCLLSGISSLVTDNTGGANYYYFNNCTIVDSGLLGSGGEQVSPSSMAAVNCIFANSGDDNLNSLNGDYNGFYNTPGGSSFGTHQFFSSDSPFTTAAAANYYLTVNCAFHNVGTTGIDSGLLSELKTMTTHAPRTVGRLTALGPISATIIL